MSKIPKSYQAIIVPEKNKSFELTEQQLKELGEGEVLVKVIACGICHSDTYSSIGAFPGTKYPSIPGHEVVGTVVALGSHTKRWKVGDRVGRGWHGDHCFECKPCLKGIFNLCTAGGITGLSHPGGYAKYMVAPWQSLIKVPESLSSEEAGPLMCAGVTVFNAMRNQHILPGSLVAIQGIGGLGHLGIQFANKMGFKVVAISSNSSKEALAKELGAHEYIDTSKQDVAQTLNALGGASMILATVFDADANSKLIGGLGIDGKLVVVGADAKPMSVPGLALIRSRASVSGWSSGAPNDTEETLEFAAFMGIKPKIELYPFEKYQEAYDRMLSGKALFRVVLKVE